MFKLDLLLFVGLNGLSFGMVLFLLAVGLVLIFGVMNIVNMAHGSYFLIGAYIGIFVVSKTNSFLLAILASMAVLAFLGIITDRFFFRYIPENSEQMFLTFGFVYIFSDVSRMIWGGAPHGIPTPTLLAGSVAIMGRPFPVYRLMLIALGLLLALCVELLYGKTRLGAIIRAGVDDKLMCSAVGINIKLVSTAIFGVALRRVPHRPTPQAPPPNSPHKPPPTCPRADTTALAALCLRAFSLEW
ncbi:MAG: branched-chain amino acid ABC transporter permease [Syntrophorhabdales bacterium]